MYDVLIIGGGITGAASFYTLSHYTTVKRVALLERHHEPGSETSRRTNNSQTLHFGDIETNYTAKKAAVVQKAAKRMKTYVEQHKEEKLFHKSHKMVLAVGEEEVAWLKKRAAEFSKLFPKNKLLDKKRIAELEPSLTKGRKGPVAAYWSPDGYAMDYGRIAQSLIRHSTKNGYDMFLDSKVLDITRKKDHYLVKTAVRTLKTKTLLVAAGNYSLSLARSLGYGKDFLVLPVGGNFYITPKAVYGKVYMIQNPNLPFAAIHADPEVHDSGMTRFGPVVEMLPCLERGSFRGCIDFFKLLSLRGVLTLLKIGLSWQYLRFVLEQYAYKLPFIGTPLYMRHIKKIIPTMKPKDVRLAKGYGGLRPQVIDTKKMQMHMGEAKVRGWKALFDITPSPGASTALKNGEENTREVLKMLGRYRFLETQYKKDFG